MDEKYIKAAEELRKKLHNIPEGSMHEVKTKAMLTDFIKQNTCLSVTDRGSCFYASYIYSDTAPNIAFRADFDAVATAGGQYVHLCGHDGHATILAAFCMYISDTRPDKNIYLIFQPGEETGEGAVLCREIIKEKNINEIYAFHNIPGYEKNSVLLRYGTFACASTGLEIRFKGLTTHAAYPENGINPAEAFAKLMLDISRYTSEAHKGILLSTVIGLDLGSSSYGVSASSGSLKLTVRAEFADEFDNLLSFIKNDALKLADEYGLQTEIFTHEMFPSTENDASMVDKVRSAANRCGYKSVLPEEPFRWSEDFGHYLELIPGAMFGIGDGENHPQLHTEKYEFPDSIIGTVLDIFSAVYK